MIKAENGSTDYLSRYCLINMPTRKEFNYFRCFKSLKFQFKSMMLKIISKQQIRTMIACFNWLIILSSIPLAAVLRSPVIWLKENRWSAGLIRLANKETSYWSILTFNQKMETNHGGSSCPGKTIRCLNIESLEKYGGNRLDATRLATYCGWFIVKRLSWLCWRVACWQTTPSQLSALVDRAARMKNNLPRIISIYSPSWKMQEKTKIVAEPVVLSEENAVRVMTIHASKGLNFRWYSFR